MPREEFFKIKDSFDKAWRKQFSPNDKGEILSTVGTTWQEILLKEHGIKSEITQTDDYYE